MEKRFINIQLFAEPDPEPEKPIEDEVVKAVKEEYEAKMKKQQEDFEAKLKEAEEKHIAQLRALISGREESKEKIEDIKPKKSLEEELEEKLSKRFKTK